MSKDHQCEHRGCGSSSECLWMNLKPRPNGEVVDKWLCEKHYEITHGEKVPEIPKEGSSSSSDDVDGDSKSKSFQDELPLFVEE